MHPGVFWLILIATTAATIVAIRLYQRARDTRRREQARLEYQAREAEREKEQFFDEVDRFFPWVRDSLQDRIDAGQALEEAFAGALDAIPASRIGTTFHGLPALLPLAERRKHLYVVGKTGSGKSTLLLGLIEDDLREGRGVGVIAPETELFRDWLLPLVPRERAGEVIYFAPGNPDCPLTFNPLSIEPGDDQPRAAGELFATFRRSIGEEGMGARMAPILGSAFAVLVGRPGATLWDVKRVLEDRSFREEVAAGAPDPYLKEFWLKTYPSYPSGSHLSILNRLDQFLRPPAVRRSLTHSVSSFSIREALACGKILFIELGGLAPDSMLLVGQMLLAKFQLELMRREAVPEAERRPFFLYADEFQTFAGASEETWRELLARGRRYGLCLTLANQHPSQLPLALQNEIFGNVASLVALNVSAKDAHAVRREFLEPADDGGARPIAAETLIELKVGRAIARLGGGALAIPVAMEAPLFPPDPAHGAAIRARSWERYGASEESRIAPPPPVPAVERGAARERKKTRSAPDLCRGPGLILGDNIHEGASVPVALTPAQRMQHVYVIGSTGTGKSTFLVNCIAQGMRNGEGLAVLDPHGDLVDEVLARVPEERHEDVILVDPADRDWPVGFNILSAHSDTEKELLASDLVAVFRRLSSRWGDQMNSVFANAVLAFLESDEGGTLADLRRFLVEPEFRRSFLRTVRDREIVYYWEKEFPLLPGRPQAPILTRLDTFLRPKLIRNMVSQRESRLDFAAIMDQGKIFLARLSQGAIGEGNAYLLGSLIVSKFHQLATGREAQRAEERRPFHLYIDECHNFVTPSMAAILSGARKYGLGLTLAHQDLQQVQGKDADVFSAVVTNPYTRVCFRLGDFDAKKLERGFTHFDARDLQSLGRGEAICHIERADYDFNLKTRPLPAIDGAAAAQRRERIVAASRAAYARPRVEVEHRPAFQEAGLLPATLLRPEPALPPAPPPAPSGPVPAPAIAAAGSVRPAAPEAVREPPAGAPTPGRGGARHKYLQQLIKRWAESRGFRATIEKPVLRGSGSVDVALERGGVSVACEISVTTSAEQELANLQKCLAAGFDHVAAVSDDAKALGKVKDLAERLEGDAASRVHFVSPVELFEFLEALEPATSADEAEAQQVRGYRVKVTYRKEGGGEQAIRKRAIAKVIAGAIGRLRGRAGS